MMDFAEFLAWSRQAAIDRPDVERFDETRIAKAFAAIRPFPDQPEEHPTVHRCDLSKLWRSTRGLSAEGAKTTLICRGVRHGLSLILRRYARLGRRVLLPNDVYPVYWRLASEAGVTATGAEIFPEFSAKFVFETADAVEADTILLPAPLKLQGRDWTTQEVAEARAWLTVSSKRRLLLDGVYSFGAPLAVPTLDLLANEQTLYLDSLSKGWLNEQVFGIAIVPEADFADHIEDFRKDPPSQLDLFRARALLTAYADFPTRLGQELAVRLTYTIDRLASAGLTVRSPVQGYLIPTEGAAASLLDRHGLLVIPASVFGSSKSEWSIVSALPSAAMP